MPDNTFSNEEEKKTNDQLYESCAWTEDEDGDWDTACDNKHCFAIDGPTENEYKYCPYCGKPIQVFKYEAEAHNE